MAVPAYRSTAIVQAQYPVRRAEVRRSSPDVIERAAEAAKKSGPASGWVRARLRAVGEPAASVTEGTAGAPVDAQGLGQCRRRPGVTGV
ncbi:hypothetical protein [Streptomyces soliscabiei]|uniref:hypothetical protein n=1 Tax=Streptomyces soliscabiei TaxID=588897 RepID=UPI0029B96562|nr:hypothetical protein [Streptomyces sp. NY05-11A]MDX2677447.1 hypothetical protein [Streptomyces sp. NY05-11A]